MCGHLQRKPERLSAEQLLETLRIYKDVIPLLNGGDFYPGSSVDILVADPEPRAVRSIWWFLLGHDGKPNYRFATFNARHLDSKLWREPIKTSRCVIPATGFGESIGEGKEKKSYLLDGDQPFLMGGLYRHYETDAGPRTGFAVITCNPHRRLSKYHDKACPLFLPFDAGVVEQWLDPSVPDAAIFHDLVDHPQLPVNFQVTPVKSTKKLVATGPVEMLTSD